MTEEQMKAHMRMLELEALQNPMRLEDLEMLIADDDLGLLDLD